MLDTGHTPRSKPAPTPRRPHARPVADEEEPLLDQDVPIIGANIPTARQAMSARCASAHSTVRHRQRAINGEPRARGRSSRCTPSDTRARRSPRDSCRRRHAASTRPPVDHIRDRGELVGDEQHTAPCCRYRWTALEEPALRLGVHAAMGCRAPSAPVAGEALAMEARCCPIQIVQVCRRAPRGRRTRSHGSPLPDRLP